ncbi:MAG: formylglycine-generating enzyme family protein, partial [Alphaproteobacteria bacterium]|nr:formylglycine-generating enzyme family protein [Alphaproteobacteria bacterium]
KASISPMGADAGHDGSAWVTGGDCGQRVLRGSNWANLPRYLRSANRYWDNSAYRLSAYGLRVARTL